MPLLRPFIFISLHIPTIHRHSLSPPRGAFIRHFTAILTQEAISHKVRERELHHPLFCWHYSTVHGENLQKCLCGNPSGIIHIFSTKTALAAARWANGATTQLQRGCFYTSAAALTLNSGCFYQLGLGCDSVSRTNTAPVSWKNVFLDWRWTHPE